jgi:3-oxoacyl-[acyl-carrier protein] reductase
MNRSVLITGGSGALGRALVQRFARAGDQVYFTWLKHADQARLLSAETGAIGFQADLTQGEQIQELAARLNEASDRIDVLVNNAGSTQVMPFALIEEEDWNEIFDANMKSMFLVTKAIARKMIAARQGVIINIGSIAGKKILEVPVHYAASKAAVSGFTLSLAKELARYNIRVNSVIPGLLEEGVSRMVPDAQKTEFLKYCLAGRPGQMTEVADTVYFLASESAGYINAQEICVDGGF